MFNKDLFSSHTRKIILRIRKITDESLKNELIEVFKQTLMASIMPSTYTLTPSSSNFALLEQTNLTEFLNFVRQTITISDFETVKDFLVEKSEMFDSVGLDIESLLEGPSFQSSLASVDISASAVLSSAMDVSIQHANPENLSAEERAIIEAVSAIDVESQLPFFLPTQRQLVIEYIRARLAYAKAVLLSNEMRVAQNSCISLREDFQSRGVEGICLNEEQQPMIFIKINEACAIIGLDAKKHFISETIINYPQAELDGLNQQTFTSIYSTAIQINKDLQAVNNLLKYFVETQAKLRHAQPQIRLIARFNRNTNLNDVSYEIDIPDLLLGYTVHNMLLVSEQFATHSTINRPYLAQRKFEINKQQLTYLKQYLSELKIWYADFTIILSCLFGHTDGAAQYIKTGQKSLNEIINIEETRKREGLTPLIHETTLAQLKQIPNPMSQIVLLIGQVALDLTLHPDRDNMKHLFEKLYRTHGFKDAKGESKTFIKTPGYEYTSLLSIPNIQGIFEDIMAQSGLTSIAQEMGFVSAYSADFLSMMGADSLIELYNQQLGTKLTELPVFPLRVDGQLDSVASSKKVVRSIANAASFNQPGNQDFSLLMNTFDERLKKVLNQLCSIILQPIDNLTSDLTSDERHELDRLLSLRGLSSHARLTRDDLLAERRRSLLSETSKHLPHGSIKTVRDIEQLFAIFKTCDAYAALSVAYEQRRQEIIAEGGVCDDLSTLLVMFENEFKRRILQAPTRGSSDFYGAIPLELTNDVLLQSFATMFYQDKTHVTFPSMVKYFLTISELAITDSRTGMRDMSSCDRGFAGRVAAAAAHLTTQGDNPLKEIEGALRRKIMDDLTNRILRGGSESSMKFANLPYILYELGLGAQPVADARNKNDMVIHQFLQEFAKVYTPAALYSEFHKAMLDNFKAYAVDEPTEEDLNNMYNLFQMLGFTSSRQGEISPEDKQRLDQEYRINPEDPASKWNLSKFRYNLSEKLIETLLINKIMFADYTKRNAQELVSISRQSFPIIEAPGRGAFASMGAAMGFSAEPSVRAPAAGLYGGFFRSSVPAAAEGQSQSRTLNAEDVRRVANSRLTYTPADTSSS
jgi:hypothetical protein